MYTFTILLMNTGDGRRGRRGETSQGSPGRQEQKGNWLNNVVML